LARLEFVALDVEATGLDTLRSEVIEVATVGFTPTWVDEPYQTYIRPHGSIPLEIVRLTGIHEEDVAHAPRLLDIEPMLRRQVGRRIIVGHAIDRDLEYLESGGIRLTNQTIDTLALTRLLIPGLPSYSLDNLAIHFDLDADGSMHRADDDVLLTAALMQLLLERIAVIDAGTRMRIGGLLSASDPDIAELFVDPEIDGAFPGITPGPSPDLRFLSSRKRPEPLRPTGVNEPIDEQAVRVLFTEGGSLAEAIEDFQHRPGQEAMASAVAKAINSSKTLVVEAGTGTGKSMAYLVPAAVHALSQGERVVISTNTIALQDQLYTKDVPALREALAAAGYDEDLKASVVKGRGNYLCLKRWFNHQRTVSSSPSDSSMRGRVTIWLTSTETGDKAELNLTSDEETAFRSVSAEGEACVASRCPFNHRNQCFLYRARRDAEASHLLIGNHALLLSDALADNSLLPESDVLIIDEAHHLEDQATKQFGFSVSDASITAAIDEAVRQDGPVVGGAVSVGADLLSRSWRESGDRQDGRSEKLLERMRDALDHSVEARRAATDFFGLLQGLLDVRGSQERSLRLTESTREDVAWGELELASDNLAAQMRSIDRDLKWFLDQIERLPQAEEGSAEEDERADVALELLTAQRELLEQRLNLHEIVLDPDDAGIYWIERGFSGRVSLHAAPLHVGGLLQEKLYERQRSIILTSATITTDGSFAYIKERLGLGRTMELATPAPFDYQRKALLFVADDMPEPNMPGYQRALEDAIVDLGAAVGGRTLVLFTSHQSLQQTYLGIKPRLEKAGIAVLAQRIDGAPRRLIERMRLGGPVVVLGAATFWEGVDIAGPALSALAIVRLPFAVPTDPVIAARSELFDNPFTEYSVPQAILRFKQGFGRLIRRHEDVGVCAVLDRRVISKRYGRAFLESLPDCKLTIGSKRILGDTAAQWIDNAVRDEEPLTW